MSSQPTATAGRLGWTIVPLALAQLIVSLDIYIVFVALPELGSKLGFSAQSLQWVISAYAVTYGGFLLLGGRAADLFGKRRMFLLALGLYGASSLVGGLSVSAPMIIVVRAIQGLGGALLFPTTLSLVNTLFEEGRPRNRALAVWGGAGASGLTLGSLLGGLLTSGFGWPSVFFVNVPLAAIVAVLALMVIPADRSRDTERGAGQRGTGKRAFDLPGALTATAGITLIVYTLVQGPDSGWSSIPIVLSAVLGVLLLVAFFVIESRMIAPLMPLRLFRNRSLVAAIAITFTFMGTFGTVPYFLTVFFQNVFGYSALMTGVAFLTQAVSIAIGTQLGERLVARIPLRSALLIGFVVGAIGIAVLAMGTLATGTYGGMVPGLVVMGLGQGVAWTAMWIAAASGVAHGEQGVASGMASTTQQTGYAVGLAIFVAIANAGTRGLTGEAARVADANGIRLAFYIIAAAALLGALIAILAPRAPESEPPQERLDEGEGPTTEHGVPEPERVTEREREQRERQHV